MRDVHTQLKRIFAIGHIQAVIFAGLATLTALLVILYTPWGMWLRGGPKPAHAGPPKAVSPADLTIHAELSQTKLIQGQNGTVYVNVGIQTPLPVNAPQGETPLLHEGKVRQCKITNGRVFACDATGYSGTVALRVRAS